MLEGARERARVDSKLHNSKRLIMPKLCFLQVILQHGRFKGLFRIALDHSIEGKRKSGETNFACQMVERQDGRWVLGNKKESAASEDARAPLIAERMAYNHWSWQGIRSMDSCFWRTTVEQ